MTSEQIELIRISFAKIEPLTEEAGVLFYARLFDIDPDLQRLFKTDIRDQGHKLMQVIGVAVENLDRLDELVPTLRELGSRHLQYGVKDAHYKTVGTALIWTLEKALKSEFTTETRVAWRALYNFLAESMKGSEVQSAMTP